MSKSIIRKAEPRDLEAINRLLRQVLAVHNQTRPDLFRAKGKKYKDEGILEIIEEDYFPIFVYEEDGIVLGYAFCHEQFLCNDIELSVKTLYIDDLCVDESARGRGIGKALFDYVKEYATTKGFYNVTLHVWNGNTAAQNFYESMGMKPQYTNLELIVNKREEIIMNYTKQEINQIIKLIEERDGCKVIGFRYEDEVWWLDVKVPDVDKYDAQDMLICFNLASVDFKMHMLSFIISDEELMRLVKQFSKKETPDGGKSPLLS